MILGNVFSSGRNYENGSKIILIDLRTKREVVMESDVRGINIGIRATVSEALEFANALRQEAQRMTECQAET